MTGWDACIYEISKQIAPLTSAKAIKDLIKAKVGEADGRMEKMKEMSTQVDNEDEHEPLLPLRSPLHRWRQACRNGYFP